jgi:hypothetical protein
MAKHATPCRVRQRGHPPGVRYRSADEVWLAALSVSCRAATRSRSFPIAPRDDPSLLPQAGLAEMGLHRPAAAPTGFPLPTIVISPSRQEHGQLPPSQGVSERRASPLRPNLEHKEGALRTAGRTNIAASLRWISRNPTRALTILGQPL